MSAAGGGGRDPGAQGATAERKCRGHTGRRERGASPRPLPLGGCGGEVLAAGLLRAAVTVFRGSDHHPAGSLRLSPIFQPPPGDPAGQAGAWLAQGPQARKLWAEMTYEAPGSAARREQRSGGGIKPTGGQTTFPTGREEIRKMMSPKWAHSFKTL